jgi:hypothetical protein
MEEEDQRISGRGKNLTEGVENRIGPARRCEYMIIVKLYGVGFNPYSNGNRRRSGNGFRRQSIPHLQPLGLFFLHPS